MDNLIIFDGVCNLCHGAVRFIVKRDSAAQFRFLPMQSALGQQLIEGHGLTGVDTFVLIKDGEALIRTDAALEIAVHLDGFWHLTRVFRVLPTGFRDFFYDLLAKYRYKLFGRMESCMVPTAAIEDRFIQEARN